MWLYIPKQMRLQIKRAHYSHAWMSNRSQIDCLQLLDYQIREFSTLEKWSLVSASHCQITYVYIFLKCNYSFDKSLRNFFSHCFWNLIEFIFNVSTLRGTHVGDYLTKKSSLNTMVGSCQVSWSLCEANANISLIEDEVMVFFAL